MHTFLAVVLASWGATICAIFLGAVHAPLPAVASSAADGPSGDQPRFAHGIAMHGLPALPADFDHLPDATTDAHKGGHLTQGWAGSFDSVNPLIVKGQAVQGVREFVLESLMMRAPREPFSLYGLIASRIAVAPDRSWVAFELRPQARFSNGMPVTVDDVVFSFTLLRAKGLPFYRNYYGKVARTQINGSVVTFHFNEPGDREIALILGLMPILSRNDTNPETFDTTSLTPLVGSGPYTLDKVDIGRSVTFRRDANYWGRELPINKGRHNVDVIRYEYFRDASTMFEAFKTGIVDVRVEDDARRWARGYDFPAIQNGRVIKAQTSSSLPSGMLAFVFNTRRPMFADQRVRHALNLLFDFEWINRNLYYGAYTRTRSFFGGAELSSFGRPADARERQLLGPFPDLVSPQALAGESAHPDGDGSGHNRSIVRQALALMAEAGWVIDGASLVSNVTREPFQVEFLAENGAQERRMLGFARAMEQIGIKVRIRQADQAQYWNRLKTFDFDIIEFRWAVSLSPGNEQINRWGSAAADRPSSLNFAGVKNPAVDAMIGALLMAVSRDEFVSAVRALDRVLLSGDYVVPLFHADSVWIAHWQHLKRSQGAVASPLDLSTWWSDTAAVP